MSTSDCLRIQGPVSWVRSGPCRRDPPTEHYLSLRGPSKMVHTEYSPELEPGVTTLGRAGSSSPQENELILLFFFHCGLSQ